MEHLQVQVTTFQIIKIGCKHLSDEIGKIVIQHFITGAMETMSIAGPFLKFLNCTPEETGTWTGCVLFLTKESFACTPSLIIQKESLGDAEADKKIEPVLLDTVLEWQFWRFDISLQQLEQQRAVQYVIVAGTESRSATFWIQAKGQPFHFGYTSCNGISGSIAEDHYSRKDPTYLWRDLLSVHSSFPLHVLVGGGDQVYSDPVWKEDIFARWGELPSLEDKISAEWTLEHEQVATSFYLKNYLESFTMDHVSTAYACIPSVMIYDDHDIWDGYGSYDAELQNCAMFQGLFKVAKRFYLLFQQHATEDTARSSGEFLESADGYHTVKYLGPQIALLGMDMRTRRTKKTILPESTYQLFRSALLDLPGSVLHVVALSGVPVVFPSIPLSENILGGLKSLVKSSACIRACGKSAGVLDRFEQPEILDDLLDGWAASIHKEERVRFIQLLQEASLKKKFRVTILSGDAHVGGIGEIYSRQRPRPQPKDDPLFIYQIISSAIMNSPPPAGVVAMLTRTNFSKTIDEKSKQKMVKAFGQHHSPTKKLLDQRNWCDICMNILMPGNPKDPEFGGLRFALRAEDPERWLGFAEEIYEVVAPRVPRQHIGKN